MEAITAALLAQLGDAPFSFRFVVQPVMAILLGLRDGRLDATMGRPPYALSLITGEVRRRGALREGLRAVAFPLSLGVVLDGVVQVMVSGGLHLWRAGVVGITLVGLPYILSRGLTNRVTRRRGDRRAPVS